MLSKPVAFGLLATACVAAAGGGAYVATRQHQRSSTSAITSSANRTPQPVGVSGGQATTSQPQQFLAEPEKKTENPVGSSSVVEATVPAPATADKRADKPRAKTKPTSLVAPAGITVKPAAPQPPDTTQPAQTAPLTAAPTPVIPLIVDPAAEAAKAQQEQLSRESEKQWEEVVVPAESVIGLQLESSISSEFARVEDRVDARVTRDVRVGPRVAIPAGSRAIGSVVLVERGGRVKERARLGIQFNTLILPDTTRLTINTETIYREGESPAGQSTAKIGGATIGGAILGAILGGGKGAAIGSGIGAAGGTAAAMSGDRLPVTLPAGTTMSVRTQAPINMTVEK
jgi:hypothetical protein